MQEQLWPFKYNGAQPSRPGKAGNWRAVGPRGCGTLGRVKLKLKLLSHPKAREEKFNGIPTVNNPAAAAVTANNIQEECQVKAASHKNVRMTSPKQQQDSVSSLAEAISPESWSKVGCPCCVSPEVEPLVLIQLAENTESNTKQWIMSMISAHNTAGGAHLLVHPGEDASWSRIDNFSNINDMKKFLTLAERQYIVQHQLESMRAVKDQRIPEYMETKAILRCRQNIFQKLQKTGVIQDVFPLCDEKKLHALSKDWYLQKRLWGQPLDTVHAYFGSSIAFYFSFLGLLHMGTGTSQRFWDSS
ncbi:hypothetical protein Q7C36_013280 [Tachysurus vachellii]|uniref:Uncharacterized protein n=1 Tax=Tachysurus vachellii TaxID=175792 RepID=A0AA88ML05_TACVA|nr:hypothetical protein Q7C36_013280 [Tachysurus vachellii]